MYQSIEGIDIGDYTYDSVCLNCAYWIIGGPVGMVCGCGNGLTGPKDSCGQFTPLKSMDGDLNSYLAKSQKMLIWLSHL